MLEPINDAIVLKILESFHVKEPNYICDHVFLSSIIGSKNEDILKALNINHILVAGSKLSRKFFSGFTYLTLELEDWTGEDILSSFSHAYEFIEMAKSKGNVLVHCAAGVSRSAAIVISYIMKSKRLSYVEARSIVEKGRSCIRPNRSFIRQLKLYERFQYDILLKEEEYLLWRLEFLGKAAKLNPFSLIGVGLDPVEMIKYDIVHKLLLDEENSLSKVKRLHITCCRKCDRWLFTKLHVDPSSNSSYYLIERLSWMKSALTRGKILCPKCIQIIGIFSLHDKVVAGQYVAKYQVEKEKTKETIVLLEEFMNPPPLHPPLKIKLPKKTIFSMLNSIEDFDEPSNESNITNNEVDFPHCEESNSSNNESGENHHCETLNDDNIPSKGNAQQNNGTV